MANSSRPVKRKSSIFSLPHTPNTRRPKGRLLTSLQNVFPFQSSRVYVSPVSDEDASPWPSPVTTPDRETSHIPYTPITPQCQDIHTKLLDLSLDHSHLQQNQQQQHLIFQIPEILSKILTFVDEFTCVPGEEAPLRRRPLSYEHALLIYKDEERAQQVWADAIRGTFDEVGNPATTFKGSNTLYNCLFVNSLWCEVALEVASTKLFFSDSAKWNKFVMRTSKTSLKRQKSNTKMLIMHKLPKVEQREIDIVAPALSGGLEWIEMYICPQVLPTATMFSGATLKKLILPGSRVVDDRFLKLVSRHCPQLENLDLRACGLVTDEGMVQLLSRCNKLTSLNLGRHAQSSKVTDLTLAAVSRYTKIETLGLAGCAISDRGLWELALHCSNSIMRLSLNGCTRLTNESLPRILAQGLLPHLSVLEIRHLLDITNFKPLVQFQRLKYQMGQCVLIEGCEVLEYRMRTEEWRQDMRNSAKVLNDLKQWCEDADNGDVKQ